MNYDYEPHHDKYGNKVNIRRYANDSTEDLEWTKNEKTGEWEAVDMETRAVWYSKNMPRPRVTEEPSNSAGWISVEERLPRSKNEVLCCNAKSEIFVGFFVARYEWCVSDECIEAEITECRAEDDELYCVEGWYESVKNWADYSFITSPEAPVTHWMPLPGPPGEGE